jgi:hypothetical protein
MNRASFLDRIVSDNLSVIDSVMIIIAILGRVGEEDVMGILRL